MAFTDLPHQDIRLHFPPRWRMRLVKMDMGRPILNELKILRLILKNLMDSWHPFRKFPSGSRRYSSTAINTLIKCKAVFQRRSCRISAFLDPFRIERRRLIAGVRHIFRNTILLSFVAHFWSILRQFHIFSCFVFETSKLQLLPESVAAEKDAAVGLRWQERFGLRASPPGMRLISAALTRCRKKGGEIPKQLPLLVLLWNHVMSHRYCQSPGLI